MTPTVQLLNIMYAPRLYAHADHWPESIGAARDHLPASFTNQKLLEIHGLQTELDFDAPYDPLVARCIEHWQRLPRICQLIGAHCLRSVLVHATHCTRLDPVCRHFLFLPVPMVRTTSFFLRTDCDDAMLEATMLRAGLAHISDLLQRLPDALRQRLVLLFPRALEESVRGINSVAVAEKGLENTMNLTLFLLAVRHALFEPSAIS